jgi:hypothetical protein
MGLQAFEAAPKDGSPVFLVDQDTGDMTTVHRAAVQSVSSQREGTSIAFPQQWLPGSKTVQGSRGTSRVVARASVAVGACALWLFIGAVGDKGLCGESNTRAQPFVAHTEKGRKIAQPNAMGDVSSLVSRVVETTVVEQKQSLERGREKIDILADRLTPIQRSDAAQGEAAQAPQSAPAWERKQPLEYGQEWDRAEVLGCAPTSSLQGELDALRSAAEAARMQQRQALDQERDRADALARELTSLWAEIDTARIAGSKAVQAPEAQIKQKQALEQERSRADALARELTSLRAELDAARIGGSEAVQAAAAEVEQKQALKQERDRAEALARELTSLRAELDAARIVDPEVAQAATVEVEQKQALKQELKRERDRAEALARELTSLRAELDTARIAGSQAVQASEAEIKQKQALEQERGRADTLARELTSLRAELDAARIGGSEAAQAAAAEVEQKRALKQELEQERGRADTLARELTSLRAELDAARIAGPEAAKAAAAAVEQQQALKQELKQERDKAEAVARELTALRAELDKARAAGRETTRTAEAVKIEQKLAFGKERDRAETLARELASARKEAEERSALLAAAHAEVLQVTETNRAIAAEQKLALASERDRAEALARELTSVRSELEAGNRQIAALNGLGAWRSREPVVDSGREWVAEHSSRTIAGKGRLPEQVFGEAVASTSGRSSASPRPVAASTAREAAPDLDPKVAMATERSASASAASLSPVDEQRLLARANTLLRQADISGARPLLEHAVERGSSRAAFMLAETYDARVLQSWQARGISGDPTKARELYERAQAGGIEDAKERIEALK